MNENNTTLNNALVIWWFFTWRSVVVYFVMELINFAVTTYISQNILVENILGSLTIIVIIFTQVYFVKMACNRNYKNFRLSFTQK